MSQQTTKGSQKGKNFAVFNDNFRGAIKGDSDGVGKGFATGEPSREAGIVTGVKGAITDFTDSPSETINYVTAHDNLNLWDKVVTTQGLGDKLGFPEMRDGRLVNGGSVEEAVAAADPYKFVDPQDVLSSETVRRSLLANGIVLTAQGIPFIHAGDELLRTKFGDPNSYRSPDAINQIRWDNKEKFKPVFDYYKGLIQLRKTHPAFRMDTKAAVEQNLQVVRSDGNVVVFKLKNFANGDTWRNIAVIYNGNASDQAVSLPADAVSWNIVVNDRNAGTGILAKAEGGSVTVPGLSMMVLYDQEDAYTPEVTSIEVKTTRKAIEPGDELLLQAVAKDQRGNPIVGPVPVWSSSAPEVASVSPDGKLTAKTKGQTVVTAAVGTVKGTVTIHVDDLVPASIAVSGPNLLYTTMSAQFAATVKDQFGQVLANAPVTWTSGQSSVASVNRSGYVTALTPGVVSITAASGDVRKSLTVEVRKYVQRVIQLQYERPDGNYTGWNLWVWGTGVQDDQISFDKVENGRAVADIRIAPGVTRIGFIVRLNNWEAKDVDSDRYIEVNAEEEFAKVIVTSGIAEFVKLPAVTGPQLKEGNALFYYRDPELFRDNRMNEIEEVRLRFNGELFDMAYDPAAEYFQYSVADIPEGVHEYSFLVARGGTTQEVADPYNTINGKSVIEYVVPDLEVKPTLSIPGIHHGQNAVLRVDVTGEDVNIREIYADLTELGGPTRFPIDTGLGEGTIAVRESVTAGIKNIPVTVVDEFGNKHSASIPLTVLTKTGTGALDFHWDEARIYFMVTDRFRNGDPGNDDPNGENYDKSHLETYHGGDFKGIIEKLDYLQDLGINTIWISPIVDNVDWNVGNGQPWKYQYAYHGYWGKDFTTIDEHLGDLETFKQLIDKAHDKGMKVMVDVVLNHAGYGMKPGDSGAEVSNYPTDEDRARFDGMLRTEPGQGDITGELAGLPDFRTEDPAVRARMIDWQAAWLERAKTERGDTIDYFRVDTVKHIDTATWKAFKNALTKLNPEFKLIGESFGDTVDDPLGFLRSGQMDALLDFAFNENARDFANGSIDAVESYLEYRNGKMDNTATMGQFLSSHDENGFLSEMIGGDESKLKLAAALQITAKGQPVIYYGEELGRSGKSADFNTVLGENRSDMPWDLLEAKADLHGHYKKLLNIRAEYSKVFSKGTRTKTVGGDADGYLVFERKYGNQSVWVGLNVTDQAKTVPLTVPYTAGTRLVDEYSGALYTVDAGGRINVQLPARSAGGTVILANLDVKEVAEAAEALVIGYAKGDRADFVTGDLLLPTTGLHDVTVFWASDNIDVVREDGRVKRPPASREDAVVTLSATLKKGSVTATKIFRVTVKALPVRNGEKPGNGKPKPHKGK